MKTLISIMLFVTCSCMGQERKLFVIKDTVSKNEARKLNRNRMGVDPNNIFEDSTYIVSKICEGEWGSTITFTDKKTGVRYATSSTCPVVVNKLNGKYYVTNTLAHMGGSADVIEIDDPRQMDISKPITNKSSILSGKETFDGKGTKALVDTYSVLALASFQYNNQLYHIITNYMQTFIAKIENSRFVTIDTVSNVSVWTYNPEVFITKDGHSIVFFKNEDTKGYLDIFGNKVTVVRDR